MKKKFLSVMILLLSGMICLSGCDFGSYIENGGNQNGGISNVGKPSDDPPDDPVDDPSLDRHYTVQVYLSTGKDMRIFAPGDNEIIAVWRSDYDEHRAELDEKGFADAGELDGDYAVYLEGVPTVYTYNPNACKATAEQNKVSILLTTIREPERGYGDGRGDLYNHIMLRYDGTYRILLNSEYDVVQYVYKPTAAGFYSIESWVNMFDDQINPYIDIYTGHENFKLFSRTLDGGGATLPGGYTKNFRYEVRVDAKEVGNSFCFALHATSKTNSYPVAVDFTVSYEGEYKSDNSDVRVIRAEEAKFRAPEPPMGQQFVFADLGTMVFDNRNFRYNDDTGRYHYYNAEKFALDPYGYGAGFGPVLYCAIDKAIPSYTLTRLINADKVGDGSVSFNYLKLYNIWIEAEQKFAVYDYTDFIKVDYANVCNSDGVCYVTKELKDFLQTFAMNHSLYTDYVGSGDGTPEALGYRANQDALWLFACGVYMVP